MGSLIDRQVAAIMAVADENFELDTEITNRFERAVRDILTPPTLEDFGLEVVQPVRYQEIGGGTWNLAGVRGVNRDGSVLLIDKTTGAFRSIVPERLQVEHVGPRGGKTWKKLQLPGR